MGSATLYSNTTGTNNTGLGYGSLNNNTTGSHNTAVGHISMLTNTTGAENTALGAYSLDANTTGTTNTAVGAHSLSANTTGSNNIAVGRDASEANTTGTGNVALGYDALTVNTTGSYNTAIGINALVGNTTASDNTVVGRNAGMTITTGYANVCIGTNAGKDRIITSNENLFIARSNTGAGNAATWIYGDSNGSCYMGTNATAWNTTSDRRLKKNIVDSSKGLAEIDQLRVTNFEYRTEDEIDMSEFPLANAPADVVLGKGTEGQVQTGVIAQEVEEILPECIKVSDKGAKTVQTDPITWALVKAVQELSAKVTALEAK